MSSQILESFSQWRQLGTLQKAELVGRQLKAGWGKRTLAYPIKRHQTGYYVVAQFEADPSLLPEFERAIKLEEGVVRFLVVTLEGEMPAGLPAEATVGAEEEDE